MAKAYRHAQSSANKFGGVAEDYLAIHEKMDHTKMAHAEANHRIIFHSAFGIYLIEDLFGRTITNSRGRIVCVRDIAEQHVIEDLGKIPSLSEWLECVSLEPWMMGLGTKTVVVVD
jgi:hypothetical protein